jgi:hypothetical protein
VAFIGNRLAGEARRADAYSSCGQGPIDQQGQRDRAHALNRGCEGACGHAGGLSGDGFDLLRVRLRHDFLQVLWDRAIHGGDYINAIELTCLINFIY